MRAEVREAIKNLRKAAKIIEKKGVFIRGHQSYHGQHCALGAIGVAKGRGYAMQGDIEVEMLAKMLPTPQQMPKDNYNSGSDDPKDWCARVARWNNMVARNGKDVACRMRAAVEWALEKEKKHEAKSKD